MPQRFRAPGRVNLIGDHTDYNEGFVMPMAIQLETVVTVTPRSDRQLVIHSTAAPEAVALDLSKALHPRGDWSDYVAGVAQVITTAGRTLEGAELSISSTVPQGSGLSSSAALEVASAYALLKGDVPDGVTVARWCQRAENEFVGARCGIMDQYVACLGQRGHALLIDCRSLESRALTIPDNVAVIVANTMVKHSVATGEYNVRRQQCEEAVTVLSRALPDLRSLRDVSLEDLNRCGDVLSRLAFKRARHVISENARVLDAAAALERCDVAAFGRLMRDSHASLRDDFEVSAPELDVMVDIASRLPGVHGSRMTGGGFGGSTVTIADKHGAPQIVSFLRDAYASQIGIVPDVMVCVPSAGASELVA
jgi:galactokinase